MEPILEGFWERVSVRGPDDCWPWEDTKTDKNGYARVKVKGKRFLVHRVAYRMSNGEPPEGAVIDHTCHNDSGCNQGDRCSHRVCCNPRHLEAVTQKENTLRGAIGRRWRRATCPQNHELTGANVYHPPGHPDQKQCVECRRAGNRRWRLRMKENHNVR